MMRRLRSEPLEGEVALVTGGSRGLGFLIARELIAAGCRVAICGRDAEALASAKDELGDVLAIECDVSKKDEVEAMIAQIVARFGRIDILVNNAGIIQGGPLESMHEHDFELSMGVMYWGVLYPTMAALPHMRRRGRGRIANVTSIGGKVALPHVLPYSSAKFAAVGFSEALHAEVAKDGISVTTIVPGFMRTGGYMNALFKGQQMKEYALFSVTSNLPLISMDAERAARRIVTAIRRRETEVILTLPAKLGTLVHGVFPGLTSDFFALMTRLLPKHDGPPNENVRGEDADEALDSDLHRAATRLGRTAAERFQ